MSDKLSKMESFYEKELQTKGRYISLWDDAALFIPLFLFSAEEGQDLKSEVKTLKASANERISSEYETNYIHRRGHRQSRIRRALETKKNKVY